MRPILVAGGKNTGLRGGRHIRYSKGTPLANLHLTLLDRIGVQFESFQDSTDKVKHCSITSPSWHTGDSYVKFKY